MKMKTGTPGVPAQGAIVDGGQHPGPGRQGDESAGTGDDTSSARSRDLAVGGRLRPGRSSTNLV